VSEVDIHPNFNYTFLDYDASILTLGKWIDFDASRQPIALPMFAEPLLEGYFVMTSGFGLTQNENESMTDLRMVELRIVNHAKCSEAYADEGGITSRMICATAAGKDSCDGGEF
jgi:hypothetical protein